MVTFVSSPLGNGCWEGSSERRVPSKIEYDLPRKSSPKFLENRVCRGEPKGGRERARLWRDETGRYRLRIVDRQIRRLFKTFGGVEVRGTKWCGKTWSALAAAESVIHVDLPNVMPVVAADSEFALRGVRPHVIDEWQEVLSIWDVARHAIDAAGGRQPRARSSGRPPNQLPNTSKRCSR